MKKGAKDEVNLNTHLDNQLGNKKIQHMPCEHENATYGHVIKMVRKKRESVNDQRTIGDNKT